MPYSVFTVSAPDRTVCSRLPDRTQLLGGGVTGEGSVTCGTPLSRQACHPRMDHSHSPPREVIKGCLITLLTCGWHCRGAGGHGGSNGRHDAGITVLRAMFTEASMISWIALAWSVYSVFMVHASDYPVCIMTVFCVHDQSVF